MSIQTTRNFITESNDASYLYEEKDIDRVVPLLLQTLPEPQRNEVKYIGAIGRVRNDDPIIKISHIKAKIDEAFQANPGLSKFVGIYNTGGNHWISFVIFRDIHVQEGAAAYQATSYMVWFKDSLGGECQDFQDDINTVLVEEASTVSFYTFNGKEQILEFESYDPVIRTQIHTNCGIFAIKNMMVLASKVPRELTRDMQGFFLQELIYVDQPISPLEQKLQYKQAIKVVREEIPKFYIDNGGILEEGETLPEEVLDSGARAVVSPNDEIATFKRIYSCMPINNKKSDNKIFEHFSGLIFSLMHFGNAGDEASKLKYHNQGNYHMQKLWSSIFLEFHNMQWHFSKPDSILYRKQLNTIEALKPELLSSLSEKRNTEFFKAYPYVKDLLFIDGMLSRDSTKLFSIVSNYKVALDKYDSLLPVLVLKEHINLMLGRGEFDSEFYSQHMKGAENCLKGSKDQQLLFFSMYVNNDTIPYFIRRGNEGFRKFDWDALHGLHKAVLKKTLAKHVSKDDLQKILESMENYLEKLILFEIGAVAIEVVPEVSIDQLATANAETNLAPAFEIIGHYLDIAGTITGNTSISKLAIARVITAIGEAVFVIKSLIPTEKMGLLAKLNQLRDHILHSYTNESFKYFSDLIYNEDNKTLTNILPNLLELKDFFTALQLWFAGGGDLEQFPAMPDLSAFEGFEAKYAENRSKDDRDVKLSLADAQALERSIPKDDIVDNTLFDQVRDFINCKKWISKEDFVKACIESTNPIDGSYRTASQLRKLYDTFSELNNITTLRRKMQTEGFDFDKDIKLKLKKEAQETLKRVKQDKDIKVLETFLFEHEASKAKLVDSQFLDSVKKIDLTHHKKTLRNFIEENYVSANDFQTAVQVMFRNNMHAQTIWNDAYKKCQKQIASFKRDHATQLHFNIQLIETLKGLADKMLTDKGMDFQSNPVSALACEMQFGLCASNTKSIMRFLDRMLDYDDKSLYFISLPHPIEEVKEILKSMIIARNNLFHFEKTFGGDAAIEGQRSDSFSIIECWTYGMSFSNAITVSQSSVSREQYTSQSSLLKLREYFALVQKSLQEEDSDTLNIGQLTMEECSSDLDNEDSSSAEEQESSAEDPEQLRDLMQDQNTGEARLSGGVKEYFEELRDSE